MKKKKTSRLTRAVRVVINGSLLTGCLSLGTTAHAAIDLQFQYVDAPGTGFLDPQNGSSWQTAMNMVGSQFSNMFGSHFSNSGTIVLDVAAINDQNRELASAATDVVSPGVPGFNVGEVIRTKLQNGMDLNGNKADGEVTVNFYDDWELNYDESPSNGKYDFYSTMYHEFTHALGFASTIGKNGETFYPSLDAWTTFDSFIVDKNGDRAINPSDYALNPTAWFNGSTGGASPAEGLFFDGPNAVAANGGHAVGLYTPEAWEDGSSGSHLDDQNPALAGMMMLATTGDGPSARDYSAVEVGMLADLGYTAAVIPEPEAYAMMLAGLGMLGWIARRRRQAEV